MKIFLKLLTLWAFVINSAFGQGDPAPFVKGMGSAGLGNSASTILVPNNQSTKINAYQALIETGNTNLLVNSGFEHSTPTTGWTLTNATAAVNTTNKLEGAKSLQVTPTVAGGGIKQIITLNASNLLGSQGVVEVPVRTSGTDVKVCFLANSVRTYCKDVPAFDASSAFKTIVTPITFDGTSNGIEVYSTGTSVFIVDEIKVGRGLPLQNVNGAKLMGTLKYAAASACSWTLTSTTYASYSADTDCATPTVTGSVKAPATKIPAVVLPQGSQAGTYYFIANGAFYHNNTANGYASYRFSDGTNHSVGGSIYSTNSMSPNITGTINLSSSLNSDTTFNIQAKVQSNVINIEGDPNGDGLEIAVYYFPPESKIYSERQDTFEAIEGDASTFGSTDTNVANFTLTKNTNAGLLNVVSTVANGTKITALKNVELKISATGQIANTGTRLSITKNATLLTSITPDGLLAQTGFNVSLGTPGAFNASTAVSLNIGDVIRIHGNGNASSIKLSATATIINPTITGSFAGIEKCANDYECTDTFSAQVSSGVVSNPNISWVTCTNANPSVCTYTANTLKDGSSALLSPMNCRATTASGTQYYASVGSSTTTGVSVTTYLDNGAAAQVPFSLSCQKGTNDYKPKTAKVASSIGVPTVPGITTTGTGNLIDTFSVSYGTTNATTVCSASPCSYLDQIGSAVTSITRAANGDYTANFGKTYSKLKCNIQALVGTATVAFLAPYDGPLSCSNCNSIRIRTLNQALAALSDTNGTISCIGSY